MSSGQVSTHLSANWQAGSGAISHPLSWPAVVGFGVATGARCHSSGCSGLALVGFRCHCSGVALVGFRHHCSGSALVGFRCHCKSALVGFRCHCSGVAATVLGWLWWDFAATVVGWLWWDFAAAVPRLSLTLLLVAWEVLPTINLSQGSRNHSQSSVPSEVA